MRLLGIIYKETLHSQVYFKGTICVADEKDTSGDSCYLPLFIPLNKLKCKLMENVAIFI